MRRSLPLSLWIIAALMVAPTPIRAQSSGSKSVAKKKAAEKKAPDPSGEEDPDDDPDRDLIIRNIVRSATKTKTTVAEAPAVIHIITADDIARFGYRNLMDSLLFIPGFLESNSQFDQIPSWMVLGVVQGVLYLRDGISMFDPQLNVPGTLRRSPIEMVKRIETMTSPGGVLWGANSFLGIVNVMTKDPEDVNGVEMGIGGGHGPGDEQVIRPYLLYGQTFLKGRLGVLLHFSVEWFKGPRYLMPEPWIMSSPAELSGPTSFRFPNGIETSTPTSLYSQIDGKVKYSWAGSTQQLVFGGQFAFHRMPDLIKTAKEGKLAWMWDGIHKPITIWGIPMSTSSPNPNLHSNTYNYHDSYAYLQYRGRWLKDRLKLDTKGYYTRFDRQTAPLVYLPYTNDLMRGAANEVTLVAHRAGVTVDMNMQVARKLKLLWGGELFYEWVKDARSHFTVPLDASGQLNYSLLRIVSCSYYNRHGDMLPVYDANNPANTTYLPGCREAFSFDSDRLVYAGYLSGEYRPHKKLAFSAGIRFQHSPAGNVGYSPVLLYSAAAVWNLYSQLYLKVNFATGFRPPVFNSTSGNAQGGNYGGDPNLKPEESRAVKTALIARLVQNKKQIRQWTVRLNYSYTELDGVIRSLGGNYYNSTKRAIHAAEAMSDLDLRGGHRLILSYTYVRQHGDSSLDGGMFRSVPNHWLTGGAVFRLMDRGSWKLDLNMTLRVIGPFEDPNQVMICPEGSDYCTSRMSDRVYDRIHPAAILNAGLRLLGRLGGRPLELTANFYNLLDGAHWTSDVFYDLNADVEKMPSPGQRFYFFLQAKFRI